MPVRLSLTEGTVADCTQASDLIADLAAQFLLADRAYDTDAIIAEALAQGMEPVIPPKKNRKEPREYDRYLYKLRHLVENAVLEFKQWRGVARIQGSLLAIIVGLLLLGIINLAMEL